MNLEFLVLAWKKLSKNRDLLRISNEKYFENLWLRISVKMHQKCYVLTRRSSKSDDWFKSYAKNTFFVKKSKICKFLLWNLYWRDFIFQKTEIPWVKKLVENEFWVKIAKKSKVKPLGASEGRHPASKLTFEPTRIF